MKVSWQVTGIRHDAYAEANRIEVDKNAEDRGKYLHPKIYNQPETMGVNFSEKIEQVKLLSNQTNIENERRFTEEHSRIQNELVRVEEQRNIEKQSRMRKVKKWKKKIKDLIKYLLHRNKV